MTNWNELQNTEKKEKPKVIRKMLFKTLKEAKQNRGIKILSYGNFSTGKTHFALSSKAPIFIIDTENGASPLADKFPDAQVLNICNMGNDEVDEKDEVKNFENFQDAITYLTTLPDAEVGTIIIDSISDIWEWAQAFAKVKIFKIGVQERLAQQWDWGIINKLYLTPIQKLINKNCNVILTARESEVYAGAGKPTGRYDPKCQKKTPYWVDIVLYHETRFVGGKIQFQAKINKCRQNEKIIGTIIQNPTLDIIKQKIENK